MASKEWARCQFTADSSADPVVFAFQAARLAVVEATARRLLPADRLVIDRPAPTLVIVTTDREGWGQLAAALEAAKVFDVLELEVYIHDKDTREFSAGDPDLFGEAVQKDTDNVTVVPRPRGSHFG